MALPGAEGEVLDHLAFVCGGNQADGLFFPRGVVKGDALGVIAAPAGDPAAGIQQVGQTVLHSQRLFVAQGDGQVGVGQLGGLLGQHGQQGILDAEADEEQGRAARHAQNGHKEALFIAEQVAGGGFLGEAHPLPQRGEIFKEDALARCRRTGQQQGGGFFLEAGAAGLQGGKADDRRAAEGHAAQCQARVEVQGKGGEGEHHGAVGVPEDGGEHHKAHGNAHDAAQNAGGNAIE